MKIFLAVIYLIVMALMFGCTPKEETYSHSAFKIQYIGTTPLDHEFEMLLVDTVTGEEFVSTTLCPASYLKYVNKTKSYVLGVVNHSNYKYILSSSIICTEASIGYEGDRLKKLKLKAASLQTSE